MTTNLQCIVYVSTATQVFRTEQLEGLLEESRRLNLQEGITGVLLYSDGNFMQCFEGTGPAMQRTYERIRQSRRHRDITELMDQPVAERNFPDWQMGLAEPSRSGCCR